MRMSKFLLILDENCSYSTNFNETHQNKRKLEELRRNSTNYILIKHALIGPQSEFLRKFFFLNMIHTLCQVADMILCGETASNLLLMCRFNPLHG